MQGQGLDGERRRRALMSMIAASALTVCAVSTLTLLDALQIDRVSAPESMRALEWSLFEPPPPSPPPPKLGGGAVATDPKDASDVPVERAPSKVETEFVTDAPPATEHRGPAVPGAAAGGPPGPGLPTGVPTGVGSTPCPGCIGDGPIETPAMLPAAGPPKPVAFEQLACRVCPDPDAKQLARTRPALAGRRGGRSVVAFCVDEHGRPFGVRSEQGFDAEVDRIAVRTVQRWRFAPMRAGKKTRKVCSSVSFDIEFR